MRKLPYMKFCKICGNSIKKGIKKVSRPKRSKYKRLCFREEKMKRKLTLIVVAIMATLMALSVIGCKPEQVEKPPKVVPEARTQVETREDAYTAYKQDGTKIGDYKTIAAAINAAVATDEFTSDNSVTQLGSYVEKDGTTIFQNRNGFAEASDDQFWFYLDGNKLEAYDCYDGVLYADYLKNRKVITHEVIARGSIAKQFHNGYALYTPTGELDTENAAKSWELSSTMDAAVLNIPARLEGVSGLNYEIDLTNVQIKPNYEGTDDTYAFIGYYAWQDYYVIATGIACNVQTGAWYPFEGTSRDDSFSDVQYNLGETPLMISNWNEEGGYWTPEYATLKTSIKTVQKEDEIGTYYVDESKYEFYTADGTLDNTYELTIDEETINQHFAGTAFDANNTFVFIAGLDIRTPTSTGVYSFNTDYTNGAEFKNLKVVSATAHVASEEEIPEYDYGNALNAEWRGKDFNILMASGEHEEDIYDYTILNTYAFAEYVKDNGADVYSFSYAAPNTAETALGGYALELQTKINKLNEATPETVVSMEALIEEVAAMRGTDGTVNTSTIPQKYYTLLDFSPLAYAEELYIQNVPLSEAGQLFADGINALPSLLTYEYVGWKTDAAEDAGYLMNDVADFKALYDLYANQLTEGDLQRWKHHVNIDNYNIYIDLMNKSTGYFAEGFTINAKEMGMSATAVTLTGEEAFDQVAMTLSQIAKGKQWAGNENDDPNGGGVKQMTSDNSWLPSYHVLFLKTRLEEAGYELPLFCTNIMNVIGASSGLVEDVAYIDTVLTIAKQISTGEVTYVTEEVAKKVNAVMVGKTSFVEGGLAWNWNNHATKSDFAFRNGAYKAYYGLNVGTPLLTYIETVQNFLVNRVGATADGIGITAPVTAQSLTVTEASSKVIALFNKNAMHGAAFAEYDAALAEFNKLTADEQETVKILSDFEYITELLEGHKNALEAVVLTDVAPIKVYQKIYFDSTTAAIEMSAKDALYQLNELICKIYAGASWTAGVDSDYGNSGKIMDYDNLAYQSIRLVTLYQYFEKNNVTLPTYFDAMLTAIDYVTFEDSYDSIYNTVDLTVRYAKAGKTVADMTAEDKATFELYWGPSYVINSNLSWNWNSGNKFEMFMAARVSAIALQYALDENVTFDASVLDGTTPKVYKFFEQMASWLEGQGYVINANGWGYQSAPQTPAQ